mgnify:FL=1
MTNKQWKIILWVNLAVVIMVLSPFLPGPSFLSRATNFIFSLTQLASLPGLLIIPIGLIWTENQAYKKEKGQRKALPILLWTVPMLTFILTMWGSDFVRDFSRNIAIRNASGIIKSIENYKEQNNTYPSNLSELAPQFIKDVPSPGIMGIGGYGYEKKDDTYNLTFSQNVIMGFNFEVVVYDPSQNHQAKGELKTLYDTGNEKWKYYIYD